MENNDEIPKIPKKKKIVSKKPSSSLASDQIQKLLREALIKNASEKIKQNELEIDSMVATMEEFLRSFILIGYNLNNEPVIVTHAKTQLDVDALYSSLGRFFVSINNHNGL
jgi:hypothetical protein